VVLEWQRVLAVLAAQHYLAHTSRPRAGVQVPLDKPQQAPLLEGLAATQR
jgi:hypothetical protein